MMKQFGSGAAFGVPTTGNLAPNPTPQQFLSLQDVSLEISGKNVSLMGQNQFPDDVAPGDKKVTGKASFGQFNIDIFNQLFFADTVTTGTIATSYKEPAVVPATSPYTVSVAQATTFSKDLGVFYASSGVPFQRVTTTPTQGQYNVSAGVYTFAAADEGAAVIISYNYTASTGRTLTVHNQLQGYGPVFELFLYLPYSGNNGMHLYACRSNKLGMPLKRDGYQIIDFEFEAFANAAGQVYDFFEQTA
jgi:hypothetical protein